MVAMIHTIRGLYNAFRYNERKIDNDKASFLYAMNFATPDDTLTARQRLRRLEERARLNHRVRVTCVSIKLTFDLAEELDADLLTKVSKSYMERMGFADQPYLAYEHKDAPTPHLHILVSPICRDGTVIPINLRKKELSKQTTQELEREFDLEIP